MRRFANRILPPWKRKGHCIDCSGRESGNIKFYVSKLLRTRVVLVLNTVDIQAKIEKVSNEREHVLPEYTGGGKVK